MSRPARAGVNCNSSPTAGDEPPAALYSCCEVFSTPQAACGLAHSAGRERVARLDRARASRFAPDVWRVRSIDLVTCYTGVRRESIPCIQRDGLPRRATDAANCIAILAANRYSIMGIVCSAEPIMTKWKWALAARLPVKVFVDQRKRRLLLARPRPLARHPSTSRCFAPDYRRGRRPHTRPPAGISVHFAVSVTLCINRAHSPRMASKVTHESHPS